MLIHQFLRHGWDPVATAIQSNLTVTLEKLFMLGFSQEDYYKGDSHCDLTPFQLAAYFNKPDILQMLLQRGAQVNAPACYSNGRCVGMMALQAAVYQGHMHVATDLLRVGADVNAMPRWEKTALQHAVVSGNLQMVLTLLKSSADVNAISHYHIFPTALYEAAYHGHLQIAMELVRAGADINVRAVGIFGDTALETAAGEGRLDMVYYLMRNNKNLSLLREDCRGAARHAKREGHTVIARLLSQHAEKLAEELGVECKDEIDESREESEYEDGMHI